MCYFMSNLNIWHTVWNIMTVIIFGILLTLLYNSLLYCLWFYDKSHNLYMTILSLSNCLGEYDCHRISYDKVIPKVFCQWQKNLVNLIYDCTTNGWLVTQCRVTVIQSHSKTLDISFHLVDINKSRVSWDINEIFMIFMRWNRKIVIYYRKYTDGINCYSEKLSI